MRVNGPSARKRPWRTILPALLPTALPPALVRERPRPDRIRERPDAWRLAVATVCFGAFMGQLDASIVTLAYGGLRTGFHASLAAVEWVSLAYLITLVALLIPVGRLSDAHGRKLLYLHGFLVFTAASAACGLAPSLGALVAFRVVQAAGAAMMQANSVALVATSAPRDRLRGALGLQAAAQALGLALGPTVGGALVATLGWRWVFGINVPIGLIAWAAGHYLLPRTRGLAPVRAGADTSRGSEPGTASARGSGRGPAPARGSAENPLASRRRFDLPGLALLGLATTGALLGLSAASGLPVPGWGVAALAAVAVAAGWAFVVRQRRAADPLLDLALLRVPAVASGLVGALCGYLVLFGPLVLVPVVVTGAGGSVLSAGAVLTALPAGFALAATGGDRVLPSRTGDRGRCVLGAAVSVAGCAGLLAELAVGGPGAVGLAVALAVLGAGLGVFTPANNTLVMAAVPASRSGTGGGLVNMARGLGTALGVALVTLTLHLASASGAAAVLLLVAAGALAATARRDRPGTL